MDQFVQFFFKHKWSTFAKGQLGFANRPSWLVILLIALALGALIYFLYLRPGYRLNHQSRWGLITLRAGLLALLTIMLMRPVVVVPSVIPKSTSVAILADDSRSMQLSDENGRTRAAATQAVLANDSSFTRNLEDKFKVGLFGFSTTTNKLAKADELKAEGAATDLVGALRDAVKESSGAPLSAIVLFSDGGANTTKDLTAELRELRARNIPVFAVGVGNPDRFKDAENARVTAPRRVLVGSAVIADVLVRLNGYGATKISLAVSEDGKALKTQQFDLKGNEAQTVTIEFTPSAPGAHRYTFEVKPLEGETTLENNAQDTLIEITDEHPKVLYVEGEPRWEYGFMRKAVAKNEKNLVLVSSLRSADGIYWHWIDPATGNAKSGWGDSYATMSTMKIVVAAARAAAYYPLDADNELVGEAAVIRYDQYATAAGPDRAIAAYVQAGYRYEQIEPVIAVEYFNADAAGADVTTIRLGVNYWLAKHAYNLKAELAIPRLEQVEGAPAVHNNLTGTLQAQLVF